MQRGNKGILSVLKPLQTQNFFKVSWDRDGNGKIYSSLLELCSTNALGSCLGLDSKAAIQAQLSHQSKKYDLRNQLELKRAELTLQSSCRSGDLTGQVCQGL